MTYISKRAKVKSFIERKIIAPIYQGEEIDYNKAVAYVSLETDSSTKLVQEIIDSYILVDKLQKTKGNYLAMPEHMLSELIKKDLEARKEVDNLIGDLVNE